MNVADLRARNHRPRRAHEWSHAKTVTFIVTLAATRNVTLAARAAGMSRKAAYALKSRDSAFADAWAQALAVRRKGNEVDEGDDPRNSLNQGDTRARNRARRLAHRYARIAAAGQSWARC